MKDIMILVSRTPVRNELAEIEYEEQERTIFCRIASASQSEFYKAAQSGYEADLKIMVWEQDYEGETLVKIGGKNYTVYRTYKTNDLMRELYLTEKVGE